MCHPLFEAVNIAENILEEGEMHLFVFFRCRYDAYYTLCCNKYALHSSAAAVQTPTGNFEEEILCVISFLFSFREKKLFSDTVE